MRAARHPGLGLAAACHAAVCLAVPSAFAASAETTGEPAIVLAQAARQAPKIITFPGNEIHGKTVATDANGLLQVLFGDGTTLTLGPGSEVTIDSFVFEPASATARIAATLKHGVFRFIGGRTSKTPDGVALDTPFGTVAIQSAGADMSLGVNGEPAHFDMVYGGGSMVLTKGSAVLARVHKPGYSIVVEGGSSSASVRKTPEEWRAALQEVLSWREHAGPDLAACLEDVAGRVKLQS